MGVFRRLLVILAALGTGVTLGLPVATAAPVAPSVKRPTPAPAPKSASASPAPRTLAFGKPVGTRKLTMSTLRAPTTPANETIGVDNTPPPGKNWEYATYYPNSNVNVHVGDVINFVWNIGSLNGFHTVTFGAASPLYTHDTGAGETTKDITGAAANNHPACGFDGELACPLDLDAGSLNSGLLFTNPGNNGVPWNFEVRITAGTIGNNYVYTCLFHPNMVGTITVASTQTSQGQIDNEALTQYNNDNTIASAAETANNHSTLSIIAGKRTWSVTAGLTAGNVELLEMLPADLPIVKGDAVNFVAKTTNEIHTVTFQPGPLGNRYLIGGPLAPYQATECDPDPDTPGGATTPPYFFAESACGANAPGYEQPFNFKPQGSSVISSGAVGGSSGALTTGGNQPPFPDGIPNNFTFTFPNNGKFTYFCKFHLGVAGDIHTAGYRTSASDGGIFTFGANDFFGSQGGKPLNQPVVSHAETPDSQGYWEVASDGGMFTFGDAGFFGSMGGKPLNKPVVGMAPTPDGGGYWEVASDGGVFTFGDAPFFGSMGGRPLNKPVVGIAATPDGGGYWEVASDGGVFTFGDAGFFGSMGGKPLNQAIVGIDSTPSGQGYRMVATDGGVFDFGDAGFFGSMGGKPLNRPMVAISGE